MTTENVPNMADLTGFQRDMLYVIYGLDEPIGLEISDSLTEYYDEEINNGRLYPNLNDLVELGALNKEERDRRSFYYTVSDEGVEMLSNRRTWENQRFSL